MNFSEWDKYKIEDICEVIDSLHKSPQYVESGFPMIRVKDMEEGFLNLDKTAFVTKEVFEEFTRKHKPRNGDILFSRVGSYGVTSFVTTSKEFCLGQNTAILTNFDNDNVNNVFIYYCLISNIVKEQIERYVTGSTQKTISLKSIKSIEVPVPDINTQNKIAGLLWNIDEKIEVKNQINKTLEAMAQAIFKNWFVDFEFPNEDGEPYKSSGGEMVESELGMIPKGWEVKSIGEIVKITRGASPRPIQDFLRAEGVPWVKISDATSSDCKFIYKTNEFIKNEGVSKSRKISPGTLILSNSATPGIPKIMLIEACVHDGWLIFDDYTDLPKEYIYYQLLNERDNILSLSNGSVFRNLKTDILKTYKIIVPTKEVTNKILSTFISINENIECTVKEIQSITAIRDTLLPKLMSGEIRVPIEVTVQ